MTFLSVSCLGTCTDISRFLRSHLHIIIVPPTILLKLRPGEGQWWLGLLQWAGPTDAGPHPDSWRWPRCLQCPQEGTRVHPPGPTMALTWKKRLVEK